MTGRARSSIEMTFASSLVPCEKCGTRDLGKLELYGDDDLWTYQTVCPSCGTRRTFTYPTVGAPYDVQPSTYELGDGPSTLISRAQFEAELARVKPLIRDQPGELQPREWNASRDAIWRTLTCLIELAKLSPNPAYDAERERLLAVLKRYTADSDRIYDLEHA